MYNKYDWHDQLNYIPLDIHTCKYHLDPLFSPSLLCNLRRIVSWSFFFFLVIEIRSDQSNSWWRFLASSYSRSRVSRRDFLTFEFPSKIPFDYHSLLTLGLPVSLFGEISIIIKVFADLLNQSNEPSKSCAFFPQISNVLPFKCCMSRVFVFWVKKRKVLPRRCFSWTHSMNKVTLILHLRLSS